LNPFARFCRKSSWVLKIGSPAGGRRRGLKRENARCYTAQR